MLHRPVELAQYTSIAFTEALLEAGITGSIGSVGDALDNALMESTIGLYKTEVIDRHDRSWSSWRDVEAATASWVHWFNHDRLHTSIGDIPLPRTYCTTRSTRGLSCGERTRAGSVPNPTCWA